VTGAWRRFGRPIFGIAILVAVVATVSPGAIGSRLAEAQLGLVVLGVLGLTAIHIINAAGWRAILATTADVHVPWRTTLALYYAAQAVGGVTPANLGGDVHRAAAFRGAGHGWAAAVAPLIVQRATSYLALSALSLLGLAVLATRADAAGAFVAAGLAFAAAVAAAAWVLLAPPRRLRGAHAWLIGLIGGSAADTGGVRRLGDASFIGFAHGVVFHAGSIGLTWLIVLAVEPSLTAASVPAALAVARLSLAVPFTPSGLGVQEGALTILFATLGLPVEVALTAMLLSRLSLVLTTVIGVGLLMRPHPSLPARGTPSELRHAGNHTGRSIP